MIMNLNEIQRIPPVGVQSRERGQWERGRDEIRPVQFVNSWNVCDVERVYGPDFITPSSQYTLLASIEQRGQRMRNVVDGNEDV